MNIPQTTVDNQRETTRELDDAPARYRDESIPKPALRIMDAETARLAASNLASRALKAGDSAPDFNLPDEHGKPVDLRPGRQDRFPNSRGRLFWSQNNVFGSRASCETIRVREDSHPPDPAGSCRAVAQRAKAADAGRGSPKTLLATEPPTR